MADRPGWSHILAVPHTLAPRSGSHHGHTRSPAQRAGDIQPRADVRPRDRRRALSRVPAVGGGARLHEKSDRDLLATLEMQRGGVRERFSTRNTFERPAFMTMQPGRGSVQAARGPVDVLADRHGRHADRSRDALRVREPGGLDAVRQVLRAELQQPDRRVHRARAAEACRSLSRRRSRSSTRCRDRQSVVRVKLRRGHDGARGGRGLGAAADRTRNCAIARWTSAFSAGRSRPSELLRDGDRVEIYRPLSGRSTRGEAQAGRARARTMRLGREQFDAALTRRPAAGRRGAA